MPVPEQTPVATFTGNGVTTDFSFAWGASATAHVVVEVNDVELVLGVGYTVPSLSDAGGTVRITPAPASDAAISIYRRTPLERVDIDYQEAGPFLAETVDLDFNTLWRAVQEVGYTVGLVPQLPVGSPLAGTVRFPVPGAGHFLRWNSAGNALEAVDVETAASVSTLKADLIDPSSDAQGDALVIVKQPFTGSVGRTQHEKNAERVTPEDFGAVGDGTHDDTEAFEKAIAHLVAVEGGVLEMGAKNYLISSTLTIPISGIALRGQGVANSIYGLWHRGGTVLTYVGTTGDAIVVESAGLPSGEAMAVELSDFTLVGNKHVPGATDGGGIAILSSTAPEQTPHVMGAAFRNVQVRNAKGSGWHVVGTTFLCSWWNCTGAHCDGNGLLIEPGASGVPTNNIFWNCFFSDNGGWGVIQSAGTNSAQFIGCNISQNTNGGLLKRSGYTEIYDCCFEANVGVAIDTDSDQASLLVVGGWIVKSPGGPGRIGIRIGATSSGARVVGTLFANFDGASDRLLDFTAGGTMDVFDPREQGVAATAFPASQYPLIRRNPTRQEHPYTQRGTVTLAGAGVGQRSTPVVLTHEFSGPYAITLAPKIPAGVLVNEITVGYADKTSSFFSALCYVANAGVGDVEVDWSAAGL